MSDKHYNQKPLRDAEFIRPPNILKAKVGTGGISDQVLNRTQQLLESQATDFTPLGEMYLGRMREGLDYAKENTDESLCENAIARVLFPCVQLKANGAMFHFPLVTNISERFVQFMEVVERLDEDTIEIAEAFYTTLKLVIAGKVKGDGGEQGHALVEELNYACLRYFEKHKDYVEEKKNQIKNIENKDEEEYGSSQD